MSRDETPEEPDRLPGAPHPRETAHLYGQATAEAAFLDALATGRPHHGWIIAGPRGIGKATLAWRIARHLVARGTGTSLAMDPADPVFRRIAAGADPQVALCRRGWDERSGRLRSAIGVEEVRGLRGFFQVSAADAGWRVAIVDAADEMTPQAANALLKTLEEPPERAMLLLVCHRPAALLPTLRSRCRDLRCRPLGPEDLGRALADAGFEDARDGAALAELAGGSVGEALRLAAVDGPAIHAEIAALLHAAPGMDRPRAIALAEACAGRDAAARYHATLRLIGLTLARLARAAAGARITPTGQAEAEALAHLAQGPAQARLWADLAARIEARTGRARAVHLDPAQVILDTLFAIDAAAAEARTIAA
jgi:DNA polymerase-3 subunit delta'